jgi:hypothetical protein
MCAMAFHEQVQFGDTAIVAERKLDGFVERALPLLQATQALQVRGACRTAVAVRDRLVQIATHRGPVAPGEPAAKKPPAKKAAAKNKK